MNAPAPGEKPRRKTWVWIPIGCLAVLLLVIGGCGACMYGGLQMFKQSEVYQMALKTVQEHSGAQSALGTPIEAGLMVQGNIQMQNQGGNANLTFPVSGPEGSGTVNCVATRSGGTWEMETLTLTLDESGETLTLVSPEGEEADDGAGEAPADGEEAGVEI
jgi:hypothetical protein